MVRGFVDSDAHLTPRLGTLLALAWPVVIARATQAVIGFCDALMIAPYGEDALAAVTTGALNAFALVIFPMGVAFIVQSFASQLHGRGDLAAARRYAHYGLILAAIAGLVAIAAVPFIDQALAVFDYEPGVLAYMSDYLGIRLFAVGALVATEVLGNWYGGLGNTRLHMAAGIVTMVVNVFLNWVLIYGKLGAPEMGVEGAALASAIATWVGLGFLGVIFLRRWYLPELTGDLRPRLRELLRMLRFGIPNGVNWFLEFSAFVVFINVIVADLGTVALAALMVVFQINSVSFMPAFGITSSGAILTGQAIGRDRPDDVSAVVRLTLLVTGAWQVAVGIVYIAIPGVLMGWFAPPTENAGELLAVGTTMLAISAAWQLFDAVGMTLSETLRAAGDTRWTMWARLSVAWIVFLPASTVAIRVYGGGPYAAILCLVGYLVVLSAVFAWRYKSNRWREIDLTGEPELV